MGETKGSAQRQKKTRSSKVNVLSWHLQEILWKIINVLVMDAVYMLRNWPWEKKKKDPVCEIIIF